MTITINEDGVELITLKNSEEKWQDTIERIIDEAEGHIPSGCPVFNPEISIGPRHPRIGNYLHSVGCESNIPRETICLQCRHNQQQLSQKAYYPVIDSLIGIPPM